MAGKPLYLLVNKFGIFVFQNAVDASNAIVDALHMLGEDEITALLNDPKWEEEGFSHLQYIGHLEHLDGAY